jgi:hypothetical protein
MHNGAGEIDFVDKKIAVALLEDAAETREGGIDVFGDSHCFFSSFGNAEERLSDGGGRRGGCRGETRFFGRRGSHTGRRGSQGEVAVRNFGFIIVETLGITEIYFFL